MSRESRETRASTAHAADGDAVLLAVRAVALVVAVAGALAAFCSVGVVVVGAAATGVLCAFRYRERHLAPFVALISGVILVVGALLDGWPDRDAVGITVVALIVAGVITMRLELLALRPLRDGQPTRRADVAVPILFLVVVALFAFALGPSIDLESTGKNQSMFRGPTRVTDADGDISRGLAPYLGFSDRLDSAARGELGDAVVLRVHASAPDYWRGESFNVWDGRAWQRDESQSRIVRTATEIPNIETDVFEQHVRVEAPAIGTLYAAYRPLLVSLPATAYRFDSDGAIKLRRPLGRGSEYTVQSYRPYVTAAILREHDPADAASPPDGTMRGPVPPRVAELARRITANAPTSSTRCSRSRTGSVPTPPTPSTSHRCRRVPTRSSSTSSSIARDSVCRSRRAPR